MEGFAPGGGVAGVQGSHHGHPVTMAAGYAVLSWLKENKEWFYKNMRGRLASLAADLNAHVSSRDYNMQFVSTDGWLDVYFQREPVQRQSDLKYSDRTPGVGACRNEFNLQLLDRGVCKYACNPPCLWLVGG